MRKTLYITLEDQLGNQLFAYAGAKCIARDLGFAFRFKIKESPIINSIDELRGNSILGAFAIPEEELIQALPVKGVDYWTEAIHRDQNFCPDLLTLERSTVLKGHLTSYRYTAHRADDVRRWLAMDPNLLKAAQERMVAAKLDLGVDRIYGVHYRCGKDYSLEWRSIHPDFYRNTLSAIRKTEEPVGFLLLSDNLTRAQKLLGPVEGLQCQSGSLFEDLAVLTLCDGHVIGNSTFAWWGAFLSGVPAKNIYRPSVFPVEFGRDFPLDIFPPDWQIAPAKRMVPFGRWFLPSLVKYLRHRAWQMKMRMRGT